MCCNSTAALGKLIKKAPALEEILKSNFEHDITASLNLLDTLHLTSGYQTVKELAETLGLNRKTITKYAEKIQIISFYDETIQQPILDYHNTTGYAFLGDKTTYDKVRFAIIRSSLSYTLLERLFFDGQIPLLKFCRLNYYSEEQVVSRIRLFNETAKKIGVKIQSSKGVFYVRGPETQIRYLIYIIFWELFKETDWPYADFIFKKIEQKVAQFLVDDAFADANAISQYQLACIAYINITRYKLGYTIQPEEVPSYVTTLANVFSKQTPNLLENFQELFEIDENEANYWLMLSLTWRNFTGCRTCWGR